MHTDTARLQRRPHKLALERRTAAARGRAVALNDHARAWETSPEKKTPVGRARADPVAFHAA